MKCEPSPLDVLGWKFLGRQYCKAPKSRVDYSHVSSPRSFTNRPVPYFCHNHRAPKPNSMAKLVEEEWNGNQYNLNDGQHSPSPVRAQPVVHFGPRKRKNATKAISHNRISRHGRGCVDCVASSYVVC